MNMLFERPMALLVLLGLAGAGTACSSVPVVGGLLGNDEEEVYSSDVFGDEEEADGRIAVLALEEGLTPDPRFIGVDLDLPPPFANTTWAQPGGEPDHALHHLSGPETYSRAWRAKIGSAGERSPITAPPVIAEGKVFTMDPEAQIRAFDAFTGDRLWEAELTPDMREAGKKFWNLFSGIDPATYGFGGGLAYDGGWLYLANGFGRAASVNPATGEKRWDVALPGPVRNPPTAANGKLFVVTISNQILALDQTTGEVLWTHESFEEAARVLSTGSPAVEGDLVVAPFSSGEVVAIDAETGRPLWSATVSRSSRLNALSTLNDIAGSPVIDRGGVFAVSHAGQLAAIDARTGGVAWEVGVSSLNTPWIAGDFIFLMSTNGELIAFSRNDGAVAWRKQLPAYENPKKRKGAITWSGPILAGGWLVLTSSSGRLILVDPQDGDIDQTLKLQNGSLLPPVIADGQLYVVTLNGQLEAWR